jgi:hypothetical protein
MKYQIEMKRIKDSEWRQYKVFDWYLAAWFDSLKGRTWTNFLLWLNDVDDRIETRIVSIQE